MPTRRKTDDADSLRIQLPLLAMGAHQPDRPLGIIHLDRMVILGPQAIPQHKCGDSLLRHPFTDLSAFVWRKMRVAAAGADDERRAARLPLGRQKDLDGRNVFRLVALRARGGARPKVAELLVLQRRSI